MPLTEMPKFKHYCKHCRFLGHRFGRDIYMCRESVVMRTGSRPETYTSYNLGILSEAIISSSDQTLKEVSFLGRKDKESMALNFALFALAVEGR